MGKVKYNIYCGKIGKYIINSDKGEQNRIEQNRIGKYKYFLTSNLP